MAHQGTIKMKSVTSVAGQSLALQEGTFKTSKKTSCHIQNHTQMFISRPQIIKHHHRSFKTAHSAIVTSSFQNDFCCSFHFHVDV